MKSLTANDIERRAQLLATYTIGAIVSVCAVWFGVNYQRAYEAEMLEKVRADLIIASAPSAIIMCDENGIIVASNLTAEQMFGWEHHLLIGQPTSVLIPDSAETLHDKGMAEAVKRMRQLPQQENWMVSTAALHVRAVHRDGKSVVDLEASIRVIKLRDGSVQFIAYFRPLEPSAEEKIEQLPPTVPSA